MRRFAPLAALLLAGCMTLEPNYARPDTAVPASWPVGDAYLRQSEAALPAVTYRDIFRDPRLQGLISLGLANNRDLMAAAGNIAAAREQYRIQRADLFPHVDAGATVTGTEATGAGESGADLEYRAGLAIPSFEIDLFGRIRSLTKAELNRYFATEAAGRTTRLALVADIANVWLTYAADASLLRIAEDTAASAERSVRLTRARLEGGIAPRTDLRQAEQILYAAQALVAQQRTALAQDVNLLQLLIGTPVDPKLLPVSIEQAAPTVVALPEGVSSLVLLRRPDVMEAEYRLRAANAEIGAARAAMFPNISLTGLLGLASSSLGGLLSDGLNWNASASAGYSIFNAGANRANVRRTEAERDAAIAALPEVDPDGVPGGWGFPRPAGHGRRRVAGPSGAAGFGGGQLPAGRSALPRGHRQFPWDSGCPADLLFRAAKPGSDAARGGDQPRRPLSRAGRELALPAGG